MWEKCSRSQPSKLRNSPTTALVMNEPDGGAIKAAAGVMRPVDEGLMKLVDAEPIVLPTFPIPKVIFIIKNIIIVPMTIQGLLLRYTISLSSSYPDFLADS